MGQQYSQISAHTYPKHADMKRHNTPLALGAVHQLHQNTFAVSITPRQTQPPPFRTSIAVVGLVRHPRQRTVVVKVGSFRHRVAVAQLAVGSRSCSPTGNFDRSVGMPQLTVDFRP